VSLGPTVMTSDINRPTDSWRFHHRVSVVLFDSGVDEAGLLQFDQLLSDLDVGDA
jgi:hypothetical protein